VGTRTVRLEVETMRPRQWSKNAFVLAGMIFAGESLDAGSQAAAWTMVAAFCLASGACYLVNDAVDAEGDRLNPRTAARPVARGDLSRRAALTAAPVVALVALGLAALVNLESLATLAGFIALQLAYTGLLKHLLFLDVMAIAAGFVLRALAGAVATEVDFSEWLLVSTALLALFLALAKRRAELAAGDSRRVLDGYSVALVDELVAVVTPAIVVVYALYAVLGAQTDAMLLTVPFVLYGIFRALFLIHHRGGLTADPAVAVWEDRPLLACIVLWALSSAVIMVVEL